MIQFRAGRKFYSIPGLGFAAYTPAAAAVPGWWLAGGIAAANCIGAYRAKGAASQAASYVNLATPGTYDLTTVAAPSWDASAGWQYTDSANILTSSGYTVRNTWTIMCAWTRTGTPASNDARLWGSPNNRYVMYGIRGIYFVGAVLNDKADVSVGTSVVFCTSAGDCYRNGNADGTVTPNDVTETSLTIGNASGGGRPIVGDIAYFLVYDTPLTQLQIQLVIAAFAAL